MAAARDFNKIMEVIEAKSTAEIAEMQRNVEAVRASCWESNAKVADCLIKSLSLAAATHTGPATAAAESPLSGPDCPLHLKTHPLKCKTVCSCSLARIKKSG